MESCGRSKNVYGLSFGHGVHVTSSPPAEYVFALHFVHSFFFVIPSPIVNSYPGLHFIFGTGIHASIDVCPSVKVVVGLSFGLHHNVVVYLK